MENDEKSKLLVKDHINSNFREREFNIAEVGSRCMHFVSKVCKSCKRLRRDENENYLIEYSSGESDVETNS